MGKVVRKQTAAYQGLKKAVEDSEKIQGKVGWFESAKYEDGTPVAYVASIQEFGSSKGNIPPRSFMRTTAAEKSNEWGDLMGQLLDRVVAGKMSLADAFELIGSQAAGDIRAKISQIQEPALSDVTLLLRKWEDENGDDFKVSGKVVGAAAATVEEGDFDVSGVSKKPLVRSGLMLNTLTNVVEGK